MAVLERIISIVLRAAQIGFAVIVAAIIGLHLHRADSSAWSMARLIYTEVVAGIAILLGLIWLLPFSSTFTHWPVDIFVSVLWWAAFGLLVDVSSYSCPVGPWANACSARGNIVRRRLRLAKRIPTRRPMWQVQGQHCLYFSLGCCLACLCGHWCLLDASTPASERGRQEPRVKDGRPCVSKHL